MTFDEAIFCMKQYLPDSDSLECMKCPYYHTVPIEDTENGFTCKADEAHKMAIKALEQGDVLREIRQEIAESKYNHRGEYNRELVFNICLQIIDNKIKETSL